MVHSQSTATTVWKLTRSPLQRRLKDLQTTSLVWNGRCAGHFYSLLVPSISPSTLTVAPGFVTSPPTRWTSSAVLLTCSCGHPDMRAEHRSRPMRVNWREARLVIGAVSEIVETAPRLTVTHVHSELVIRSTTAARRTAAHVAKSSRTRHQLQGSRSEGS